MAEINENADHLVEELEAINKRAFGMALSVHKNPSLRSQLAGEANLLRKRLMNIADELQRVGHNTNKPYSHWVSESILDLDFVVAERDITSLRLGDIIKWG